MSILSSSFVFGLLVIQVLYASGGKLVGLIENEKDEEYDTHLITRQ